ncbi:hypothetical protein DRH14_03270 [Candidatus Shapirobacteria bacterium]|nr:MAG: hypothetical protein DRH14_03270 [Candidatus Shapirobacteria bacterium]
MKKNKLQKILLISLILASLTFLSACSKKNQKTGPVPTPTPRLTEIELDQRPYISLIPRADGHELKLKIDNIPSQIRELEYEIIYTAIDKNLEIEKGMGDPIKIDQPSIERDLLLGVASCTNGCKYSYDKGVSKGTISIVFTTNNDQVATYQSPFVLQTSADIKKKGKLSIDESDSFYISAKPTNNQYFILLQNYNQDYSVFASGSGKGTVSAIHPDTFHKDNLKLISGDYHQK